MRAKESAMAAISEGAAYGNGLSVEANGSRSQGYVSLNLTVKGVQLALDEAPPAPPAT
jgi:hypothetical protein